jgi:hypothetical protein
LVRGGKEARIETRQRPERQSGEGSKSAGAARGDTKRKDRTSGTTSAEILEQARDAIPDILSEIDSAAESTEIFDPGFRRRLEWARREQAEHKEPARRLHRRPVVEVTGAYGDYLGVRVGDGCWRMPVRDVDDVRDIRIGMWDPSCSGPEPLRLDIHRRAPGRARP